MSVWLKCDNCETMAQLDDRPCDRNGDLAMPDGWVADAFRNPGHLCGDCDQAVTDAIAKAQAQALASRQPAH